MVSTPIEQIVYIEKRRVRERGQAMRPHMKINHEGGHAFHDGKCQRCEMLESRFYDLDSPTRGKRCTGRAEQAERMFIED